MEAGAGDGAREDEGEPDPPMLDSDGDLARPGDAEGGMRPVPVVPAMSRSRSRGTTVSRFDDGTSVSRFDAGTTVSRLDAGTTVSRFDPGTTVSRLESGTIVSRR
jgi:hypothetical protein